MINTEMMLNDHYGLVTSFFDSVSTDIKEEPLYADWQEPKMRRYLAAMHNQLNYLADFMNRKARDNMYYNADQSRELLDLIKIMKDDKAGFRGTEYDYILTDEYQQWVDCCTNFLQQYGGNQISVHYQPLTVVQYTPIFMHPNDIRLVNGTTDKVVRLKEIGQGSYAIVYKYKDENYDTFFGIKRAKQGLSPKELGRFYQEYQVMRNLNSPYIVKVYSYDSSKCQYSMELGTCNLEQYIQKHPRLPLCSRKRICRQILAGFRYLHLKGLLHRDVAFNNILVFEYDDVVIVKISDLGLVKLPNSDLTDSESSIKGSLRDPSLDAIGYRNYSICNEIYSMTRLIYFVMTSKKTFGRYSNPSVEQFVLTGTSAELDKRYKNDDDLLHAFEMTNWGNTTDTIFLNKQEELK